MSPNKPAHPGVFKPGTDCESCLRILSELEPHQRTDRVEKGPCGPEVPRGALLLWSVLFIFILLQFVVH